MEFFFRHVHRDKRVGWTYDGVVVEGRRDGLVHVREWKLYRHYLTIVIELIRSGVVLKTPQGVKFKVLH